MVKKEKFPVQMPKGYKPKTGGGKPKPMIKHPVGKKIEGSDYKKLQPWQAETNLKMDILTQQSGKRGWTGKIISYPNVKKVKKTGG